MSKSVKSDLLTIAEKEKAKREKELVIANAEKANVNKELTIQITERKQAEKALFESEERFRLLFNQAPLGYQALDFDGNFMEVNQTWLDTLGYTREEVIGKWFGDFLSPAYQDGFLKRFPIFKAEGKIHSEFEMVHKNGNKLFIAFEGKIGYDNNGEFKQTHCILQDITENKQKEEELKNSEAKHSSMISNISDVIGIIGLDGFMKFKSPNVEKWFGWQPQDLVGTDGFSNVHPDDLERLQQEFVTLLEKENLTTKVEFRYKCKDGSYKPVELNAINLTNDPIINGILLNYHDITERKESEQLIKESQQEYKNLVEHSPNIIYKFSNKRGGLFWSERVKDILGFSPEEIKNNPFLWNNSIHPDDRNAVQQAIENSENGIDYNIEYRIKTKSDKWIWLHDCFINATQIGDEIIIEGQATDITALKQAEEELKNKMDELIITNKKLDYKNKEVEKRSTELIKAKEKAEESDRLKSAFLTNMSHEIRTPMNGILGFAELLKEPNLSSDDMEDYIQTIQISGARMLNTINNIVDISKIESGLIQVDIKETNINEEMEFTYKFFKPEAEIKGLQFLLKNGLPSKEAIIKTDNGKVYGILANFIKNAIKFTFDGSIEFGYVKKGEYLEFFVKDTGIGIPQKRQQLIFERFRQGSESYNRGYEGSGLGLSISKSYVEMLGGRIWVESEEGLGSTFYFTIPYIALSEEKTTIEKIISAEHKEIGIKNLKILIVEDDEISYSLLSKTLQKISKEVLHAITGVEAIDICRNNPDIDLVLMDIQIPKMDGNEATRQIRQFNKNVIIIAQTAYAFAGDSEKVIEAGCNDYIYKPINKTLLYELIKKHCDK